MGKCSRCVHSSLFPFSSSRPTVAAWNIFKLAAEQIMALHEGGSRLIGNHTRLGLNVMRGRYEQNKRRLVGG
jgi:hypothetical protein